jgi:hypothetical protein
MPRDQDYTTDLEPPSLEPPSSTVSDDAARMALVDRILAIAHLPASAHVAVIGHRTLPFVLALMRKGSTSVRSLRPDAPSPDCEPAELAWIVDIADEDELDEALRAARGRTGTTGRVILEQAACCNGKGAAAIRDHALAAGLDVVSFDHVARRVVLAATSHPTIPRLAMVA